MTQAEPARYTGPAMSDQQNRSRRRQGRSRTPPDTLVAPPVAGGAPGQPPPGIDPDISPGAAPAETARSDRSLDTDPPAGTASPPHPDADPPTAAQVVADDHGAVEPEAIRRGREPGEGGDGSEIPWHMRPWKDDEAPSPAAGPAPASGDGVDGGGRGHPSWPPDVQPHHHAWVYAVVGVFLLALAFGGWGLWTVFRPVESLGGDLPAQNERLRQEISTLRRSDQISREANRDLQRTLAERDEEIAGLRADVAFYERFVGATGQRRGLSVHELKLQPERDDAWRFVATLTQNLNRGAINSGRLTVSVEGMREGRLQRLAWSELRQQTAEPGLEYSFKYFQQVEGNLILPAGFEPLRMTVRLVPEGGSAVEQSFPWADVAAAPRAPEGGAR